jgi:hypothetical protein
METFNRLIADLKMEDRRLGQELKRVRRALAVLRGLGNANGNGMAGPRVRRRLSAAARKRIADAQRARWAKFRAKKAA